MSVKLLSCSSGLAMVLVSLTIPARAAIIILHNTGGAEVGTQAYQGFATAANFWAAQIKNNITIDLDVGVGHLGPNILASTQSNLGGALVQDVENQLLSTGTSRLDAIAKAHLPALSPSQYGAGGLSMITPGYTDPVNKVGVDNAHPVFDHDGSINNILMSLTSANAKALGLGVTPGQTDGSIKFSSDFAFDFNPTNGIGAKQIDFVGVATHEIGHALGFVSSVDDYDAIGLPNGPLKSQDCGGFTCQDYPANNAGLATPLDLFRYSRNAKDLGGAGSKLTWVPGVDSYFSVDGGATSLGGFSTGAFNGDGWQASHWKRQPQGVTALGIMDPAVSDGQLDRFTARDFAAFDAIGYNFGFNPLDPNARGFSTADISRLFRTAPVPEPSEWALVLTGVGAVGFSIRRNRRRAAA